MSCCKTPLWFWMVVAGILLLLMVLYGINCSKRSEPQKPFVHATRAFTDLFGGLPSMPVPGPCYATVAYFPSSGESGKFRPAAIFTTEQGKEERLTVRTVVRGIREAGAFSDEVVFPFPEGSDLTEYAVEKGVARIVVGGAFRLSAVSEANRIRAAQALALTASQFGNATSITLTDAEGKTYVSAAGAGLQTADIGIPRPIGLLAVREKPNEPARVLALNFDRPVFVEDIGFAPAGSDNNFTGKSYSTGFGMTVEFHPDPEIVFDDKTSYRVRLRVHDGKGRKTIEDSNWTPKLVDRD